MFRAWGVSKQVAAHPLSVAKKCLRPSNLWSREENMLLIVKSKNKKKKKRPMQFHVNCDLDFLFKCLWMRKKSNNY